MVLHASPDFGDHIYEYFLQILLNLQSSFLQNFVDAVLYNIVSECFYPTFCQCAGRE